MTKDDKQRIRDEFVARLKEAMAHRNIDGSLNDKARALGLVKSSFVGYYNAEKLPSRGRSLQIAARLGVREAWLMEGIPPMVDKVAEGIAPLPINHWSKEDQEAIVATWRAIESKYNPQRTME